jgi:hypothetical protein
MHKDRVTAALVSLDAATAAFLAFLDRLPDTVAVQSLPKRWTPAGHASHVALTNDVFFGVLQGGLAQVNREQLAASRASTAS